MERRLNNKLSTYLSSFKQDVKEKITERIEKNGGQLSMFDFNDIIVYMYDYDSFNFTNEDFAKRKRVKNTVPLNERCSAKRANNEQCTRRKKCGFEYCGTHIKGIPNGCVDTENIEAVVETNKVEVWAEDIRGISYYLDKQGNVYEAEDVVMNRDKPRVIAKYVKNSDDVYTIPELGII